jgi:hypothetical protein
MAGRSDDASSASSSGAATVGRRTACSGLLALSFSGLAPAREQRDRTLPGLPWYVDVNPDRPFRAPQGTIPAGAGDKAGLANRVMGSTQMAIEPSTVDFFLSSKLPNVTPTELQRGAVTSTFPVLQRVTDPVDSSAWSYLHRLNMREIGIDGVLVTAQSAGSSRIEVAGIGRDRYTPSGTEEWAAFGILFPEYWRRIDASGDWYIWLQYHDARPGLTGNPPISMSWEPGFTTPGSSCLRWYVRRYENPDWPLTQVRRSRIVHHDSIANPAANVWHWLVLHYRSGCGYTDPNKGAIYGPIDPSECFVRLYHAVGNGPAVLAGSYEGFWGSPYRSDDPRVTALAPGQAFQQNGYWRNGLYMKSRFRPRRFGDERAVYTKGHRVYRAADLPIVTADDILLDYRGR